MHLAYLSSSTLPSKAANSVHVMKMCAALSRNGADVTLFGRPSKEEQDPFIYYGVEETFWIDLVDTPDIRWVGGILQGLRVRQRLLASGQKPDLLYGRHIYSLAWTAGLGIPFIIELHHIHPKKLIRALTMQLLGRDNCLGAVVISSALKQDLLALAPWAESKVIVAHDAADDPVAKGLALPQYRETLSIRVGYVGHLYEGKGMEVIAELAERMPQIDFQIVGGTPDDLENWQLRVQLDNVVFDGFIPHGQLPEKYLNFDVCLLPVQERVVGHGGKGGRGEIGRWTSPLKMFEYMSYGLPIIASDVPVLREILEHDRNALLVAPKDIDGWSAAVKSLAADPLLRERLGRQARADFLQSHTWSARAAYVMEALVGV